MDYSKLDDEALPRLIASKNEPSLGELYERYGKLVFSLAFNTLGEATLAEEITQDVFLRVWERGDSYLPEQGKVIAWLARIARNRAIDVLRRQKVRPEGHSASWAEMESQEPAATTNLEEEVELAQQKKRIRQAISQLPEEQKQALALAYFKGRSHQEISAELGVPLGTIKTRIRLAMQKLSHLLGEDSQAG